MSLISIGDAKPRSVNIPQFLTETERQIVARGYAVIRNKNRECSHPDEPLDIGGFYEEELKRIYKAIEEGSLTGEFRNEKFSKLARRIASLEQMSCSDIHGNYILYLYNVSQSIF